MPRQWEYTIKAFYPPNRGGGLAIETGHDGLASRDIEIAVFRERIKRGEISHIEVTSHVEPFGTETIWS